MNDDQLLRYSRQIMLPGFDIDGQQRLLDSRVLILGMGGLGSPVALYLGGAGVGELWLADDDRVELSNLQRQIAHATADVGRTKVDSVADSVAALNPDTQLRRIVERLGESELMALVPEVDLVVDASDNFAVRFAMNRACVSARVPLVSAAAIRGEGQLAVFDARRSDSPCYHCLYPAADADAALSCSESGVLAPLVGVMGSLEALEAIKLLSGYGEPAVGSVWLFDGAHADWRQLRLPRNPQCPVCGES